MKVGGGGTGGGEGRKSGKEVLSLLINDQHVPLPRRQHQHKHKSCSKSALSCPAARMGWPLAGLLFCRLSPLRKGQRTEGENDQRVVGRNVSVFASLASDDQTGGPRRVRCS